MTTEKQAHMRNQPVYEATMSMLKSLKESGAIIGRTDSKMLLRPDKISSTLFEEIQDYQLKLAQVAEVDGCFVPVFTDFVSNAMVACFAFHHVTVKQPWEEGLSKNDQFPFIEQIRDAIMKLPMLGEEHLVELQELANPELCC